MKRSRKILYGLTALVLTLPLATSLLLDHFTSSRLDPSPFADMTLIAHAGGGLEHGIKSNAKEAFDSSANLGFHYIEADFSETQSGDLVLIHNWEKAWHNWYSPIHFLPDSLAKHRPKQALTIDDFMRANMRSGLTQMSAADLMAWSDAHPEIRIITDFKDNPVQNLTRLRKEYPRASKRLIPQIYHPDEYADVKILGYDDIIFTAYRSKLPDDEIIAFMDGHSLFALTGPIETITDRLITEATLRDIPVWVHRGKNRSPLSVVNTPDYARQWKARGISGIYTDYLYPTPREILTAPSPAKL